MSSGLLRPPPTHRRAFPAWLVVLLWAAPLAAQTDLSVVAITHPASGCALTTTEDVTVRIFNFGTTLSTATSFNVSYTINAGSPVTEQIVLGSPLLANTTVTYTFTTKANVSAPGTYIFDASVAIAGDVNPTNDAFTGYEVTNSAPSVGGTVAGGTDVCAAGNSGDLILSGHTGTVQRWERSEDGGVSWIVIANTTSSQGYSNLVTDTLFRAVVQNGSCGEATSASAEITVAPPSVGGAVSGSTLVCSGSNGGVLGLSGQTGAVVRWERSEDGGSSWIPIANTTTSQGYTDVAVDTLFRAAVQSSACPLALSAPALISMLPPTLAISAPAAVCPGSAGNLASVVDLGGSVSYAWSAVGGTITAGGAAREATFTAGTSGPVELSMDATLGTCHAVGSLSVPLRFASGIQPPAVACSGGSQASVPDAGAGAVYLWSIANGVLTGGLGTREVTFKSLDGNPVSLQAVVLSQGCLVNDLVQVPSAPSPATPLLLAPAAVESGVAGIAASVEANPSDTFDWTLSDGSIDAGQGTDEILFTAGSPGPSQLTVIETNVQGCSSVPVSAQVQVRAPGDAPDFFTLAPCRLVDTRVPTAGGPALGVGETRHLTVLGGACGVPATAVALALNVTTIATAPGTLRLGAGNELLPGVGLALRPAAARATQAIVRLATDGSGRLVVGHDSSAAVDLVLDVVGWFQ